MQVTYDGVPSRCRSWRSTACRPDRRTASIRARSSPRTISCCRRRAARSSSSAAPPSSSKVAMLSTAGDRRRPGERQQSGTAAGADRDHRCAGQPAADGRADGACRDTCASTISPTQGVTQQRLLYFSEKNPHPEAAGRSMKAPTFFITVDGQKETLVRSQQPARDHHDAGRGGGVDDPEPHRRGA